MLSPVSTALAKGKNVNDTAGIFYLALCRSSVDTTKNLKDQDNVNQSWGNSCCSKKEGYCVECLRGKNYCTKYPYSSVPRFDKSKIENPANKLAPKRDQNKLHDHRKIPGGTIITPNN